MYNFEGIIHSFYYNVMPDQGPCNFETNCDAGCGFCPDYDNLYNLTKDDGGFCLSECDYN